MRQYALLCLAAASAADPTEAARDLVARWGLRV